MVEATDFKQVVTNALSTDSKATRFPNRIIIGVTGGTASGKTTMCERLGTGLKADICILSLDSFYRGLT